MTRAELIRLLERYAADHPGEDATTRRIRALLEHEPRCFERDCYAPGHVTASAWIVSRERRSVLLTHHRKLDRWLQLGGHTDGEVDVLAAALREAREESGIERFTVMPPGELPVILDVDVHLIPARPGEPAHEHHDIRFLLEASEEVALARQRAESKALRWFPAHEVAVRFKEPSLARMADKAAAWLTQGAPGPR